jgi:hypothetical protein
MKFYLGTHRDGWLKHADVPLFISNRVLKDRKTLPVAVTNWALDSGGFSELSLYGEWRTLPDEYLNNIKRYKTIGKLDWVAPQDWMCEPFIIQKTRLSVKEHQKRTVENFIYLKEREDLVIPVIQGFTLNDYETCIELYSKHKIDLTTFPIVGIGSVCRRQHTYEIANIIKKLSYLNLHGFGVKLKGLDKISAYLKSSDSMSWSFNARKSTPLPECSHNSCANCYTYARQYYNKFIPYLT